MLRSPPPFNFRSKVLYGIADWVASALTDIPAALRSAITFSVTFCEYWLLSIWDTLLPIWGTGQAHFAPCCGLHVPGFGFYAVHMDINEATSKAIGAERAIAGMTIRELAEKSGIPLTSLQRVLQAEREIKINQVAQIASALGVYPHEIVEHAERILERENRTAPVVSLPSFPALSVVPDIKAAKRGGDGRRQSVEGAAGSDT